MLAREQAAGIEAGGGSNLVEAGTKECISLLMKALSATSCLSWPVILQGRVTWLQAQHVRLLYKLDEETCCVRIQHPTSLTRITVHMC